MLTNILYTDPRGRKNPYSLELIKQTIGEINRKVRKPVNDIEKPIEQRYGNVFCLDHERNIRRSH